jgi:CheY-like chemotaxis protein
VIQVPIAYRLLLADDDIDTRELVADRLRSTGYDVKEVGDGRDALAAIIHNRPSLLITDCNMPNMSGTELVQQLARDASLSSIPAIVVSAVKQCAMPSNVIAFLPKPFAMATLQAAIRTCLEPTR